MDARDTSLLFLFVYVAQHTLSPCSVKIAQPQHVHSFLSYSHPSWQPSRHRCFFVLSSAFVCYVFLFLFMDSKKGLMVGFSSCFPNCHWIMTQTHRVGRTDRGRYPVGCLAMNILESCQHPNPCCPLLCYTKQL